MISNLFDNINKAFVDTLSNISTTSFDSGTPNESSRNFSKTISKAIIKNNLGDYNNSLEKVTTGKGIKKFDSSSIIDKQFEKERYMNFQYEKLKHILCTENFESGIESEAEKFVRSMLKIDKTLAQSVVSKLFYSSFGEETNKDTDIVIGILNLISHLEINRRDYAVIKVIPLAAVASKNDDVKDYAIQCFENWNDPEDLPILRNIDSQTPWLNDYINKVIESLSTINSGREAV